jgi:hypothetical protein
MLDSACPSRPRRHRTAGALKAAVLGAVLALTMGACAHHHHSDDSEAAPDDGVNAFPATYKAEILAAMHAYLNDPTGIREPAIAEPSVKAVGQARHFTVCLRLNPRERGSKYAGTREMAAVFVGGRFDHFVDPAKEICAEAAYTPFPELGKLTR